MLGNNYGANPAVFEEDLREIVDELAPRPTILFTVTMYRARPGRGQRRRVRRSPSEYDNVRVIDWAGETAEHPELLGGDGLHLSDAGRARFAEMLADELGGPPGAAPRGRLPAHVRSPTTRRRPPAAPRCPARPRPAGRHPRPTPAAVAVAAAAAAPPVDTRRPSPTPRPTDRRDRPARPDRGGPAEPAPTDPPAPTSPPPPTTPAPRTAADDTGEPAPTNRRPARLRRQPALSRAGGPTPPDGGQADVCRPNALRRAAPVTTGREQQRPRRRRETSRTVASADCRNRTRLERRRDGPRLTGAPGAGTFGVGRRAARRRVGRLHRHAQGQGRPGRPQRRRQDEPVQGARRPGRAVRRTGDQRRATSATCPRTRAWAPTPTPAPACPTCCRVGGSTPPIERIEKLRDRHGGAPRRAGDPAATPGPRRSSAPAAATPPRARPGRSPPVSASTPPASTGRSACCRAASAAASRSPASSSPAATCSASTSRPTTSTSTPRSGCSASCASTAVRCS